MAYENRSKDELERQHYIATVLATGTWSYNAGTGNGADSSSGRIVGITVFAPTDTPATFTIAGGASITVPTNGVFNFTPNGLTTSTVSFSNTASWVVERVN